VVLVASVLPAALVVSAVVVVWVAWADSEDRRFSCVLSRPSLHFLDFQSNVADGP